MYKKFLLHKPPVFQLLASDALTIIINC